MSEFMETNMAMQGELKDKGRVLLKAAHEVWMVHQKLAGPRAVVWLTDTSGHLVLFTRGEYKQQILQNIEPLSEELPLDEPFLVEDDDDDE